MKKITDTIEETGGKLISKATSAIEDNPTFKSTTEGLITLGVISTSDIENIRKDLQSITLEGVVSAGE